MNKIEIMIASPDLIEKAWVTAYPLLSKAWEQGVGINDEITLEEIELSILAGGSQLWLANTPDRFVAALVTQIVPYRKGYSCDLNLYATEPGYNDNVILWLSTIEDWAVKRGCKYMHVVGRLGWKKVLKKEGFKLKSITMCKEIILRTIN